MRWTGQTGLGSEVPSQVRGEGKSHVREVQEERVPNGINRGGGGDRSKVEVHDNINIKRRK